MSKHLSNTERLRILEEYLGGSSSKYAIQKKYGLSAGCIRFWLRKVGLSDKPPNSILYAAQQPTKEHAQRE